MTVRLLLSVVFAVALLAVAAPAVEDARQSRQVAAVEGAASKIAGASAALVASGEPPPTGMRGARRTIECRLPDSTALVLVSQQRVIELYVDGRQVGSRALPRNVYFGNEGQRLRLSGRVRLTIAFERRDGRPVLAIARGFISEGAAKMGYAIDPRNASTSHRLLTGGQPLLVRR